MNVLINITLEDPLLLLPSFDRNEPPTPSFHVHIYQPLPCPSKLPRHPPTQYTQTTRQ